MENEAGHEPVTRPGGPRGEHWAVLIWGTRLAVTVYFRCITDLKSMYTSVLSREISRYIVVRRLNERCSTRVCCRVRRPPFFSCPIERVGCSLFSASKGCSPRPKQSNWETNCCCCMSDRLQYYVSWFYSALVAGQRKLLFVAVSKLLFAT